MRTFIVDTNAFLRFLLDDIPEQKEAVETLFKNAENKKYTLIVPQIVVFEIYYSLEKYYHVPKEVIVTQLLFLVSNPCLQIQNRDMFQKALKMLLTTTVSFPDTFLAVTAAEKNAELFTFDKKLQKLKQA
jgi:predicted nucleic acid-binding protein